MILSPLTRYKILSIFSEENQNKNLNLEILFNLFVKRKIVVCLI